MKKELNKIQKFYIQGNPEKTVEELAEDLGVSVALVQPHMVKKAKRSLFAKRDGIVVMTEAASKQGDNIKHSNKIPKSMEDCIHRIRPDDPIR